MSKYIHGNLLRLRISNGKTQEEIANEADISLLAYRNIESGKSTPSINTLESLAKVFNVSVAEFLKEINVIEAVRFRALKNKSIKKREEIIYSVSTWLEDFNELIDKLNDNDKYTYKLKDLEGKYPDPKEMAKLVRKRFGDADDPVRENEPIRDICGLLEFRAGIKVYAKEFNSDNFFGLSLKDSNNNRVIAINTWDRISVERRIFTAAHELGHILLHSNSYKANITDENEQEEKEADIFASYFLMPEKEFINEWIKCDNCDFVDRVIKVKQIFRVSYKVVLYRLNEIFKKRNPKSNIWSKFYIEYAKKYKVKLSVKDEMQSLDANTKELQSLSSNFYFGRGIASLVKKAYYKKLITTNEGARILGFSNILEMQDLIKAWELEEQMIKGNDTF